MKKTHLTTTTFLCLALGLSCIVTAKTNTTYIIGGGNILSNSQSQIEENVIWINSILSNKIANVEIYFGSGKDASHDVVYRKERRFSDDWLNIIYTPAGVHLLTPFKNTINTVTGTTQKQALSTQLGASLKALPEDQEILITYNGHGGLHPTDTNKNYLKLWQDTELDIAELNTLLDQAPKSTTIRFVATQCYSGAFSKLTLENPNSSVLSQQQRCGFMAESALHESEGCELETNIKEFRDYTTYFYSALDGKTRTGESIKNTYDINADNIISFREAHLYTLVTAHSGDLSRSTSEVYLEQWEPWYFRWSSWIKNPMSIYSRLAKDVTKNNNIPTDINQLHQRRAQFKQQYINNKEQQKQLKNRITNSQNTIKLALESKWPQLKQFTVNSDVLTPQELTLANEFIKNHTISKQLKQDILQLDKLRQIELTEKRQFTQIDKVFRLKKLARLEHLFERFATQAQKQHYHQLIDCENGTL